MTGARRRPRDERQLEAWRNAPGPRVAQPERTDEERRLEYTAHMHPRLAGEGAGTYALRLRRLAGLDGEEEAGRQPGEDDDEP